MRGCSLEGGMHGCSRGGMRGCSWGACMVAPGGVCMVAPGGGMHGCSGGTCMVAWGVCMVAPGGPCMVALGGAWLLLGGHAWLLRGACVVAPRRGGWHAWDMTRYGDTINERAVRILLECILVLVIFLLFLIKPYLFMGAECVDYSIYIWKIFLMKTYSRVFFVILNLFVRKSKPSISLLKRKVDEWQLDAKVQVYLSQEMKLLLLDYAAERYVLLKLPA